MSDIEYEMETLALSDNPADKERALKYYQSQHIKQNSKPDKIPAIMWERKTAAEILKTEYEPLKWVVPGIIPEGLTICNGSPKVGKSWLALHLASAVSCGGYFMGTVETEQKEVLLLALEDNFSRIKDRLIKQGGYGNDKLFIETSKTWNGGIGALKNYVKQYPDTGLIIIDTLFKFCPLDDTNEYSKTYKPLSLIQEIAAETRISIVLIHHTRKGANSNTGENWQDESMGSTGFSAAVDSTLLLQKKDGKNEGTLRIKGRDIEEKSLNIIFDKDICTWRIIGETSLLEVTSTIKDEILKLLSERPEGLRNKDLCSLTGKDKSAISRATAELIQKGKITKTNDLFMLLVDNRELTVNELSTSTVVDVSNTRDKSTVNNKKEPEIY